MAYRVRIIKIMALVCALSGCKETLHSGLSEEAANEASAVLLASGISASKHLEKGNLFSITVPKAEFGAAVVVLSDVGLPQEKFDSIGTLFPSDSVVGTPFEEHVRFSFAVSQEVSRTLTEIDGVQSARVHVVIPQRSRFDREAVHSKAAVAIYHHEWFDSTANTAQIKTMISFSVPELTYDNISVAYFKAGGISNIGAQPALSPSGANGASLLGVTMSSTLPNNTNEILIIAALFLLGVFLILKCFQFLWGRMSWVVSNAK